MKILMLIVCFIFAALSIYGENPEMPVGNGDEGVQVEQWAVTNYPETLRSFSRYVFYHRNVKLYVIISEQQKCTKSLEHLYSVAQSNFNNGVISEKSLLMIRTICDQIKAGEDEQEKYNQRGRELKKIDHTTKEGERLLHLKITELQNDWNKYAKAARAEIETNIQALTRLLKEGAEPAGESP